MTDIMDLVRTKKADLQAKSGRRDKTTKPLPGKSLFRILPGWREGGDPMFYMDFSQHFIKDTKDNLKAVYLCIDKTFGKVCPICESIEEGMRTSDDDDVIAALKESKSKGRMLFNALHLNGSDPSTPIILDLTPTTAEKVLELMEEYGNITDLTKGTDLVINRTGKGLNTEYSVLPAAKSKTVNKAVLANLHNLDDYVKQEYEEGHRKALAAVGTVSGIVPKALSADKPSAALTHEKPADDDPFETASADKPVIAAEDMAPEVVEAETTPLPEGDAVPAPDDEMSTDELDAMLKELG